LVGVSFEGRETARVRTLSLAEAKRLRARVDAALGGSAQREGHDRWFFHGFDVGSLYFFVGRYHTVCRGLGCTRYAVDTLYAVPRSPEAERAFGVADEVGLWDGGRHGIRGGMPAAEVERLLGKPAAVEWLQYTGSFRWSYPGLSITFLDHRVAWLHEDAHR
jgi:hypothetical protein